MPYAPIVENLFMVGLAESIAPIPAILQKGLVKTVSHEMLKKEAIYQASMQMFRSLLENGAITREDYAEAERMMREKYKPVLGTLFSDIALT